MYRIVFGMVMPKGSKHSDETRARMAAASKARWADPEYREKMREKHRARVAANGNAQQKKAAAAAAEVLRGSKKTPEQKARSVAARRANNGGRYFPEGGGPCINMEAGPAPESELGPDGRPVYEGDRPDLSEACRKAHDEGRGFVKGSRHSPETIERMREARKKMWADGTYENRKPATRRRVSKMELSLISYLEPLGYQHVDEDHPFFVYHPAGGMVPDFVDRKNKRVFEFFGDHWHQPEDEAEKISRYAESGWSCTVLWEHDLDEWIAAHTHTTPV